MGPYLPPWPHKQLTGDLWRRMCRGAIHLRHAGHRQNRLRAASGGPVEAAAQLAVARLAVKTRLALLPVLSENYEDNPCNQSLEGCIHYWKVVVLSLPLSRPRLRAKEIRLRAHQRHVPREAVCLLARSPKPDMQPHFASPSFPLGVPMGQRAPCQWGNKERVGKRSELPLGTCSGSSPCPTHCLTLEAVFGEVWRQLREAGATIYS